MRTRRDSAIDFAREQRRCEKFFSLFPSGTFYKPALDARVCSDERAAVNVHSAVWKFYLVVSPGLGLPALATFSEWRPLLEAKRRAFWELRARVLPPLPPDSAEPLTSPEWAPYHDFKRTRDSLLQCDIDRLFVEHPYFLAEKRGKKGKVDDRLRAITELLYIHMKANPSCPYRQGFGTLCAVLYYCFRVEMQAEGGADAFATMFDRAELDADVYCAFASLIDCVVQNGIYGDESCETSTRLGEVKEMLRVFAPDLYPIFKRHEEDRGIDALMFRWIRLLFAEDVGLDNCFGLWNLILASYPSVIAVKDLAVGLLLLRRPSLLLIKEVHEIYGIIRRRPVAGDGRQMEDPEIAAALFVWARAELLLRLGAGEDAVCQKMEQLLAQWDTKDGSAIVENLRGFCDAFLAIEESNSQREGSDEWLGGATVEIPEDAQDEELPPLPKAAPQGRWDTTALGLDAAVEDAEERGDLLAQLQGSVIFRQ